MVLVTGKAGYIGAYVPGIGVDDLSTGKRHTDHVLDIRDSRLVELLEGVEVVVHLAAVKSVDESVADPIKYWDRNLCGTLRLCESMLKAGVTKIVFASSAAVYGNTPYGQTKLACEQLIKSLPLQAAILRLFNVGGGSLKQAMNKGEVTVYGTDYPTRDGSCERDYIHELDVANAIRRAKHYLMDGGKTFTADIGTGETTTVLEAVQGHPYKLGPRRPGDLAVSVANPEPARTILGFEAKRRVFETH